MSIRALVSFAMPNSTISTRDFAFFLVKIHKFSHMAKSSGNFHHQLQGRILVLTDSKLTAIVLGPWVRNSYNTNQ